MLIFLLYANTGALSAGVFTSLEKAQNAWAETFGETQWVKQPHFNQWEPVGQFLEDPYIVAQNLDIMYWA